MPASSSQVGIWLADLAAYCGLGQAEIAARLGHVRSWVNHIFQGRRSAPPQLYWTLLAWTWEAGGFTDPGQVFAALGHYLDLSPAAALAQLQALRFYDEPLTRPSPMTSTRQSSTRSPSPHQLRLRFLTWLQSWERQRLDPRRQGLRLPDWYIPRQGELACLHARLSRPAPPPLVLWGPAGTGKSVLAQALALDPTIQQQYWSGVLWAQLGPQGNPYAWLCTWCRLLGCPVNGDQPPAWREQFRQAVTQPGKRYLVIVDDVWDFASLEPLLLQEHHLTWLFTTRDRTLSTYFPTGDLLQISAMPPVEARALLERLVGAEQLQQEPPAAGDTLLAEVEYLPLAVRLLGSLIRLRGWAPVLRDVSHERTRLVTLALGPTPTAETSLRLALQVSYAALPAHLQRCFAQLGVFGSGHAFSGLTLAAFWEAEAPDDDGPVRAALAEQALGWLYDVGLLELVSTATAFVEYRLHTLVHDYARLLLREQQTFEATQQRYVAAYLALLQHPDLTVAALERQWPNLQLAFTCALQLGWYEAGMQLWHRLRAFMLARAAPELLEVWLRALEAQEEQLPPEVQQPWRRAQASGLPPTP